MTSSQEEPLEFTDSILRRLPPGLSEVQMLALDVVSNARDIIALANLRLNRTLTQIAMGRQASSVQIASAFADAWSVVDAVDRIRSMVKLLTLHLDKSFKPAIDKFITETQTIRALRNVTDHLPHFMKGILSSDMPSIGRLSWVTVTSTSSALSCSLDPGTIRRPRKSVPFPDGGGRTVLIPTSAVQLSADTHKAWLDDAAQSVYTLAAALEAYIEQLVEANGVSGLEANRNLLAIAEISFPEQMMVPLDDTQGSLF